MKFRILAITTVLVAGFVYATSVANWSPGELIRRVSGSAVASRGGPLWSGPSVTNGAGLSNDEVNNVEIYKMAHPATVFITSTTLRQDFFLQVYPSKATGSGFAINDRGQIITNFHVVSGSQELTVWHTPGVVQRLCFLVRVAAMSENGQTRRGCDVN